MRVMDEPDKDQPSDPKMHSFPDVGDLVGQASPSAADADDYEGYAEWAMQADEEPEPFPHTLELNEAARQRKEHLDERMSSLLARLASEDVSSKGYYSPGGEAEVVGQIDRKSV